MRYRVHFFAHRAYVEENGQTKGTFYGGQQQFMLAFFFLHEAEENVHRRTPVISENQLSDYLTPSTFNKSASKQVFKSRFWDFKNNFIQLGTPLIADLSDHNRSYSLESVEDYEVDVWELKRLIMRIDSLPWKSSQFQYEIVQIHDMYRSEFISSINPDNAEESNGTDKRAFSLEYTKALDWIRNTRDDIKAAIAEVYDKYVVCLLAEKNLSEAEQFIINDWIPKLRNHQDIIWGYFRLLQIYAWTGRPEKLINTYNAIKILDIARFDPEIISAIDILYEFVISKEFANIPEMVDADEFSLHGSNFTDATIADCPINRLKNPPIQIDQDEQEPQPTKRAFVKDEYSRLLSRVRACVGEYLHFALNERIPIDFTLVSPLGRAKNGQKSTLLLDVITQQTNQLVLITGVAGVGKTTVLYELASQYLTQAFRSREAKVPIIIPLSYWKPKYKTIKDLLLGSAVNEIYGGVSYESFRARFESRQIILLLDGLEDISPPYRQKFLDAIFAYLGRNGDELPEMVITYQLPTRKKQDKGDSQHETILKQFRDKTFWKIVLNQPQLHQQIEYLHVLDYPNSKLKSFLETAAPSWFKSLAETPLSLSLMSRIYADWTLEDLKRNAALNIDQLWEQYIEHQYQVHPFESELGDWGTKETMIQFLRWLARRMPGTDFNPNAIDSGWLDKELDRRLLSTYIRLTFIFGSLVSLLCTLAAGIGIAMDPNLKVPIMAPLAAVGMWIAAWGAMDLAGRILTTQGQPEAYILDDIRWSAKRIFISEKPKLKLVLWWGFLCGSVGLIFGIGFALINIFLLSMGIEAGGGLGIGMGSLALGIMLWYVFSIGKLSLIEPTLIGLISGLVFAVGATVIAEQIFNFQLRFPSISVFGGTLASGLAVGLCTGICKTFYNALRTGYPRPDAQVIMEQTARRSLQKALAVSIIFGIVGFIGASLMSSIITGWIWLSGAQPATTVFYNFPLWIAAGANAGLLFLIASFLFLGGVNVLEHIVTRSILDKQGLFPFHEQDLLNVAVKLHFLRRIGNRYELWHSTFREYLQSGSK